MENELAKIVIKSHAFQPGNFFPLKKKEAKNIKRKKVIKRDLKIFICLNKKKYVIQPWL